MKKIPVRFPNGSKIKLSPGEHNRIEADIIEKFAPRFAPGASVTYIADTANKGLYLAKDEFEKIGVQITDHGKLPDVVLLDEKRNRLFLIEAVTSHGPMAPKRVIELQKIFSNISLQIIFITAFGNFSEFRKHLHSIAWETEVWISEIPDHLIHYNGDKFL